MSRRSKEVPHDRKYLAALKQAILDKYGPAAILTKDRLQLTDEQERQYLENLREEYKKSLSSRERLFMCEKNARVCPTCGIYSFEIKDDLYFQKFGCCFSCYVRHVEWRIERNGSAKD